MFVDSSTLLTLKTSFNLIRNEMISNSHSIISLVKYRSNIMLVKMSLFLLSAQSRFFGFMIKSQVKLFFVIGIAHFLIALSLSIKTKPWCSIVHMKKMNLTRTVKSHFQMEGLAPRLALRMSFSLDLYRFN